MFVSKGRRQRAQRAETLPALNKHWKTEVAAVQTNVWLEIWTDERYVFQVHAGFQAVCFFASEFDGKHCMTGDMAQEQDVFI